MKKLFLFLIVFALLAPLSHAASREVRICFVGADSSAANRIGALMFSYVDLDFKVEGCGAAVGDGLERLHAGKVDLLASFAEIPQGLDDSVFVEGNVFFAVRAIDVKLAGDVRYAMSLVMENEGGKLAALGGSSAVGAMEGLFSEREKRLVKKYSEGGDTLNVILGATRRPYSYIEHGKSRGMIPDFFAEVMKRNGMNYKVVSPRTAAEFKRIEKEGTFQIVVGYPGVNLELSPDYVHAADLLTLNFAVIRSNTPLRGTPRIAVIRSLRMILDAIPQVDTTRLVYVNTPEQALSAVVQRRADETFMALSMVEQLVNIDLLNSVSVDVVPGVSQSINLFVSKEAPRELVSILRKSLRSIPKGTEEVVAYRYGRNPVRDVTVADFAKYHSMIVVVVFIVFAVLFFIILYLWMSSRMKGSALANRLKEQEELKRECSKAVTANRAKSRFLLNMSHDIRTPMNAILGFLSRAEKNIDDKALVKDSIVKSRVSGNYLLQLIDELLDITRIELDKVTLIEEVCDIKKLGEDLCKMTDQALFEKSIDFKCDFSQVQGRYVVMDGRRVRQMVMNVLSNAVKYTPAGGSVHFSIRQEPCEKEGFESFAFVVADTGVGMSREYVSHVYDEFSRGRPKEESSGSGLGMSIVKRLVDLMGGDIDIQSAPNRGTTVTIRLQVKSASAFESGKLAGTNSVSDWNKVFRGRRVLLVEDNEFNREVASDMLRDVGLVVDCADDGSQAVNRMKAVGAHFYDCILMDIQMPVKDGYVATREIRAMFPNEYIPIIALSANAFEEDRKKSLEMGMYDHLSKPFEMGDLMEAMGKLLDTDKA